MHAVGGDCLSWTFQEAVRLRAADAYLWGLPMAYGPPTRVVSGRENHSVSAGLLRLVKGPIGSTVHRVHVTVPVRQRRQTGGHRDGDLNPPGGDVWLAAD